MRLRLGSAGPTLPIVLLLVASPVRGVWARESTLADVADLFDRQEYDEARRKLDGLRADTRDNDVSLHYLGRLSLIDGKPEEAVDHLRQAVDLAPEKSEYRYWLATAETRRIPYRNLPGKMSGSMTALAELRKAIELDPENLLARMSLFQMTARSPGMPGSSRDDLREQADSISGIDSVMGHVALGAFFQLVEKDTAQAVALFDRAHALAPENRAAAISYADLLWELDRRDEAIGVLQAFVERVPGDRPAHFNLAARLILGGGAYATARDVLERCLELESDTGMPSDAIVRWCLGLACHLLGDEDMARAEWSRAYDLDGDLDRLLEAVPQMAELKAVLGDRGEVSR